MVKYLSASIVIRFLFIFIFISVLGLALYPNLRLPEFTPSGEYSDFVYHMIAFLLLTVSATIALDRNVLVVISMVSLAIALELLQAFVPGRSVFLIDVGASLLGVLFALLTMQIWRRLSHTSWRHGS
ncbi:MAG: VanZ family protein [Geminicoccaceae bacterium]